MPGTLEVLSRYGFVLAMMLRLQLLPDGFILQLVRAEQESSSKLGGSGTRCLEKSFHFLCFGG